MLNIPRHGTAENTVAIGIRLNVLLDGEVLRGVVAYHLDEGWVELMARDAAGNYILHYPFGKEAEFGLERRYGSVTVEVLEDG